jgi:hypothetical protein
MLKRLAILCSVLLLSACASNRITEFGDRSLAYGWLDITEVDANRLHGVTVYQFRPQTSEPYYHTAVKKFKETFKP